MPPRNTAETADAWRQPFGAGGVSLRLYPPALDDPTKVLDELQEQASLAEANGFDGIMLSERHGGAWGQIPNPLQVSGFLLAATSRVWIAACPLLLPLRRPAIVAEEVAWLAARFAGRVCLGLGSGGNESDFALVGVPFEERSGLFNRNLRELVAILRGDDTAFDGDRAIVAARASGLPLASTTMSITAARRAAELDLTMVGSSLLTVERTVKLHDAYLHAGGNRGHMVIARAWLGDPPIELMRRQLQHYAAAAPRSAPVAGSSESSVDGLHTSADPQTLAGQLVSLANATRADALNIRVHVAGLAPAAAREQIAVVGREVLPVLRARWRPPQRRKVHPHDHRIRHGQPFGVAPPCRRRLAGRRRPARRVRHGRHNPPFCEELWRRQSSVLR